MLPKFHLLSGIILSIFLILIFPNISTISLLIIIFSTFLIDIDHYIYYVFKKKDFSLIKSYNYFYSKFKQISKMPVYKRKKYYTVFPFLHGIEILFIVFLLSIFVSKNFFFVLIGFSLHIFLDFYDSFKKNLRNDRLSVIYDFIKFKKLKYLR